MWRKSLGAVGVLSLLAGLACVLFVGDRSTGPDELSPAQMALISSPDDGESLGFLGGVHTGIMPNNPAKWLEFDKPYTLSTQTLSCGCFAPGTPDDVVQEWFDQMVGEQGGAVAYNTLCRWPGTNGSPRLISWSFAPDGLFIPSVLGEPSGNNELFSRMDALFNGNRATWVSKFQESFNRWEQLGGTFYERRTASGVDWDDGASWGATASSQRGDVRICMKPIDGSSGILGFNPFPCSSFAGDMHLDRQESWNSSFSNWRFLRNVIMHEHGHGAGLLHVCPVSQSKLMEPFASTAFDGPRHDDIRAIHALYGDAFENDDTAFIATDVGEVDVGSPITVGTVPGTPVSFGSTLSIDRNGEQDFFEFSLPLGRHVTATAQPVGLAYDSSTEGGGGCNSGNFINSNTIANLSVQILGSDGSEVLSTCEEGAIGQPEVCEADILDAGTYFVRVYENSVQTQSQLYQLTIAASVLDACVGVECDDGQFCNGQEFCTDGNCFDGTAPCDSKLEICDEDSNLCQPAPGACCLPNGNCAPSSEGLCGAQAGFYYGDGTSCDGPLDPECFPAPTVISCTPSSTLVFPDTSVDVTMFIEDVLDLAQYQVGINIITTGTGEGTLDCSACTGGPNEPDCAVRVDEDREDWVFADETGIAATSCLIAAGGGLLIAGSVDVAPANQKYLVEFTIDISSDATPGTEFEVQISPDPLNTAITNSNNEFIGYQTQSCVLTVADPGDCLTPVVSDPGSRSFLITPQGAAPQALRVWGDAGDPDVSCVSSYVQADGTLGPAPVFLTPAEWGSVAPRGLEIIPSETYNVQAECSKGVSAPTQEATWAFADLDNNGIANLADTFLAVLAFQGDYTNVTPWAADVEPCIPNGVNNLGDAFATILGFQGQTYADVCESPCP
ncbi:MAG: matrixin family metalloprotease [Planctomycetota bacterium]|jgi:hypothetical protein